MTRLVTSPPRSQYRFNLHGATPQLRWQMSSYFDARSDYASNTPPAAICHPTSLALEDIVDHDNLIRVWKNCAKLKGQAAGPDGLTYPDFSPKERGDICRVIEQACLSGRYRPSAALEIYIPKRTCEWASRRMLTREEWLGLPTEQRRNWRNLSLRNIPDRVTSSAINERLALAVEPILLDGVMGYRRHLGVYHVMAAFYHAVRELGLTVFAQDDIVSAFPNVRIADVVAVLRRHISDPGTLHLINAVLRGMDGSQHEVGISQGDPISPVCLNLLLHYVLDQAVHEISGPANRLWLRYADNVAFFCQSTFSGTDAIRNVRQQLASTGFRLKGGYRPLDLTQESGEILGFRLRIQDGTLRLGLTQGALSELNQVLSETQGSESPITTARAVVQGWVRWYGPAWEWTDAREVAQRAWRQLSRIGLGEAHSEARLLELMEAARLDWVAFRGEHSLPALVGDQLGHLRPSHAPRDA